MSEIEMGGLAKQMSDNSAQTPCPDLASVGERGTVYVARLRRVQEVQCQVTVESGEDPVEAAWHHAERTNRGWATSDRIVLSLKEIREVESAMAMSKGAKIVAPFLKATSSSGVVHGVENAVGVNRTVCGKPTTGADLPVRRFQSGVDNLCERCYGKVSAARVERISLRKQRYNAKKAAVSRSRVLAFSEVNG